MLEFLKKMANKTFTENNAVTYATTLDDCLDFFSTVGALRSASEEDIINRFQRAFSQNPDIAMKILFYARDIREGLGERRVFKIILKYLAQTSPETILKNIEFIPEYGRYDDILPLLDTQISAETVLMIKKQLDKDLENISTGEVSLLAKWLPSVNASSKETIRLGKKLAKNLGYTDAEYRKTLSKLRKEIKIIENNLREKDYTFDYSKQPSRAMFKYRRAFVRNDNDRYMTYLNKVKNGKATMNTSALYPYDIVRSVLNNYNMTKDIRDSLDTTWKNLKDYTDDENAIAVIDGSASMYRNVGNNVTASYVAMSLGIYFAQHNKGAFHNHFITFSDNPRLVEIKGKDIVDQVLYIRTFNEVASTNIEGVFDLILETAVANNLKQADMPTRIYIISDMEFNQATENSKLSNFENAKLKYNSKGYKLPEMVFWNLDSRNLQQPVTKNETGTALVSGFTPRTFDMIISGELSPIKVMIDILSRERYSQIMA